MSVRLKALTKSIWVFHLSAAACNNCDIEVLDLLTPRYDVERFGIQLVGSVRHADAILLCGVINRKSLPRVKRVLAQAPKPCVVIAVGVCPCSGTMFRDSYNFVKPADELFPIDAYVPGCPPKPEAMISAVVKLVQKVRGELPAEPEKKDG